ncbi:UNVERIFIED_CONTAM: UPF0057 membrane protein [Sesamum calycinum]|uniref:UPF0057 membrane protein n=1 Tax=Sesamum calycinum TaxID=2727403 RepID=A0AAW2IXL1_9LAMI
MASRCEILCEILLAILIPPLGVCLRHGCCTVEFFICLVLTILGYIPGIIYALYAIVFIDRDRFRGDYYQPSTTSDFLDFLVILSFPCVFRSLEFEVGGVA